jgi:hypothetical protein
VLGSFLPMRIVKCVVAVAPYPAYERLIYSYCHFIYFPFVPIHHHSPPFTPFTTINHHSPPLTTIHHHSPPFTTPYHHNVLTPMCCVLRFITLVILSQFRYTPAAVVLATGGTSALVANTTYIVISQVSECKYSTRFSFCFSLLQHPQILTLQKMCLCVQYAGPRGLVRGPPSELPNMYL